MGKQLTVIIPTYNRCKDVCKNVLFLDQCITNSGLSDDVKVIVSDNHSDDDTYKSLTELKKSISNDFEFRTQFKNIGGTFNRDRKSVV